MMSYLAATILPLEPCLEVQTRSLQSSLSFLSVWLASLSIESPVSNQLPLCVLPEHTWLYSPQNSLVQGVDNTPNIPNEASLRFALFGGRVFLCRHTNRPHRSFLLLHLRYLRPQCIVGYMLWNFMGCRYVQGNHSSLESEIAEN